MTFSSPAGSPPTPETTPDLRDVLQYFTGAAELMIGRTAGLKRLDISPDGFWTSFFAILVALPPAAFSWMEFEENERAGLPDEGGALLVYGVHAAADLAAWIVPIAVLMLMARPIGFSRKIVPLVIATNWGGALIAWATMPYFIIAMLLGPCETTMCLAALVSIASIVFTVSLTSTAIGRDLPAAIGIVVLMFVAMMVVRGLLMDATGVALL